MPDPVSVCNEALGELGATFITSFAEGTSLANLCASKYPTVRDETLEMAPWNFATKRKWLTRFAEGPAFGWLYQYEWPPDCLVARGTDQDANHNGPPTWDKALNASDHRVIVSNQPAVGLVYTARVEDLNLWSTLARQVLVKKLAASMAKPVTGQNSVEELKIKEALLMLQEAKRSDGREGTPRVLRLPVRMLAARHRTGGVWPYTFPPVPEEL